jgi:hypothetical protein
MDIQKIEKLLSKLAKNGDKETINNIIELLSEVASYNGIKSANTVTETHRYQAPVLNEARYMSPSERACAILDEAAAANFKAPPIVVPTYNDYSPNGRNFSQMANNVDITSHAADLFG